MPALSDKNQIELSVVVATYNRGGYILDTLLSLAAQTLPGPKWELLVVNNNSTDDTEAIVEQFARENPGINVRHVVELQQGVSYARTRGVTDSRGGYIVYVDDDELVNDRFLEVFYDFFEARPEVGAAGGRTIARYTESVPRWMSPFTERPIACIVDHGSLPRPFPPGRFFGGGNMALRRTMFDKYGLFDTGLGRVRRGLMAGEEKEFYMRMKEGGEQIWYLPDAVVEHVTPPDKLTGSYFRRLTRQIGSSEKVRTQSIGRGAYLARIASEVVKWGGVAVLSIFYTLTLRPAKAKYIIIMRWQVTLGLLGKNIVRS